MPARSRLGSTAERWQALRSAITSGAGRYVSGVRSLVCSGWHRGIALRRFVGTWVAKTAVFLTNLRSIIVMVLVLFGLYILGAALSRDIHDETILIEPIAAPPELVTLGFTPEVIAQRLVGEFGAIRKAAVSSRNKAAAARPVAPFAVQLDVDVPWVGVSYRSMTGFLRRVLCPQRERRIRGEIIGTAAASRLWLRDASGNLIDERSAPRTEPIEVAIRDGAERIVRSTDPYVLAVALVDATDPVRTEDALSAVRYCVRTPPQSDDAWCYNIWGRLLVREKDRAGAIEKYKQAIALQPNEPYPYVSWGNLLAARGDWPGAIEKYSKAVDLDEKYAVPYNNWGTVLEAQCDSGGAIERYERAIALDPTASLYYDNLGVALAHNEDSEGAIHQYERAIDLEPRDPVPYVHWGNVLADRPGGRGAIKKYRQAIHVKRKYANPYNDWGRVLAARRRWDDAIRKYKRAIALDGSYADPYNGWGDVLAARKGWAGAVEKYKRAIGLNHGYPDPHNGWGNVLAAQGNWAAAIEQYQKAIALSCKYPDPYNGWGNVLAAQGSWAAAIEQYEKAIALNGEFADPYNGWGDVLADQRDWARAIEKWENAIMLRHPDSARIARKIASARAASSPRSRQPPRWHK